MIALTAELEKLERAAAAPAPEPRHESGRAQQIERIDPADGLEIARDGALEGAGFAPKPLGEQRLLKHFQTPAAT